MSMIPEAIEQGPATWHRRPDAATRLPARGRERLVTCEGVRDVALVDLGVAASEDGQLRRVARGGGVADEPHELAQPGNRCVHDVARRDARVAVASEEPREAPGLCGDAGMGHV